MNFLNWYRPATQLAHQAALGVQVVVGYEQAGPVTREQYKSACRALGLSYFMQAPPDDATLAAEASDPFCLGWDQIDEPNAGAPSTIPVTVLQANYAKWKAAAPNKIVLLNFEGSQREGWVKNPDGTNYDYKAACAAADWVMMDFYVRNRLGPGPDIKATMGPIIDQYKGYAGNKPFGFWLETCPQNLQEQGWAPASCGPSPKDIQDYFDIAVAKGCQIIGLFEDVIGRAFESFGGDEPLAIINAITSNTAKLKTPLPGINPPALPSGVGAANGSSDPMAGVVVTVNGVNYKLVKA